MKSKEEWGEIARESADHCLACNACMSTCPVMKVEPSYYGPKLIGPAHSRLRFAEEDEERSLRLCSNCKTCDRSCPHGVRVSTLNMLHRGEYYRRREHPKGDHLLAHTERTTKILRQIPWGARLANAGASIAKSLGMLEAQGIAGEHILPPYAPQNFRELFYAVSQETSEKKVVFFPGCYIGEHEPQVGLAFLSVMQKNGIEVILDDGFSCCGSPLVACGYLDEAEENARRNIARLLAWKKEGIPVVACCTSCSLMLKEEYRELFGAEGTEDAAGNVYDAFEFLENLHAEKKLNLDFKAIQKKLLYHIPCHLKSQAIGAPAAGILGEIPGISVVYAEAECCGLAGNYGLSYDRYEIAMQIGAELFQSIQESDADGVISDCGTCRLQILHGTKRSACHPMEILAEAYGGARAERTKG